MHENLGWTRKVTKSHGLTVRFGDFKMHFPPPHSLSSLSGVYNHHIYDLTDFDIGMQDSNQGLLV